MSVEGWGAKFFWKVKTGVLTGGVALAVAAVPAGARGEAVTPTAVSPHAVTPHLVSPSAPADPASSSAPEPAPEPAPSPGPAPVANPSAAENPSQATSSSAAPEPQGNESRKPFGADADPCPPYRDCTQVDPDRWKNHPDTVTYFVFTRLICPLWIAIAGGYHDQLEEYQSEGHADPDQIAVLSSAMENARMHVYRSCITSVIP